MGRGTSLLPVFLSVHIGRCRVWKEEVMGEGANEGLNEGETEGKRGGERSRR